MADTIQFKRGAVAGIPTALSGEPLWTTDSKTLYVGDGTTNYEVVMKTATQTLTNKTLTSPTMTAPVLGAATGTSLALGGALANIIGTSKLYATGTGGTAICCVNSDANFGAVIVRGGQEGDMILQATGATSGRQAFYFRVNGGFFDIILLNDSLSGVNDYIYSTRYDGFMSLGFGANNSTTMPGVFSVGAKAAGNIALVARGAASQTANIQEWQNSGGTTLASVRANGVLNLSTITNSSPQNGDIWSDGSDIKVRLGGVTYTLTKV